MNDPRDFERPILEVEEQIENLRLFGESKAGEMRAAEAKLKKVRREVFSKLTPWQVVQVARHPRRPHTLDYLGAFIQDFVELHGDRRFGEDPAMVVGVGKFRERPVCVIGQQKGRDTKQKVFRNFGMPRPEGYRKALRVMRMAERFHLPVFTFIDTPGAYPGMDAEERGQAEAIAYNLEVMSRLRVPVVVTVIGEGGSGGALAIGVGDRVNMLQHSIYSVISPEGCAAILWKDAAKAEEAAAALKLTAPDLKELGLIDRVIPEPPGGAHADPAAAIASVEEVLAQDLAELERLPPGELYEARYAKYRGMGVFLESAPAG
jgi:acetyl-CoA carboxylase carboxyl transferase subunit alpha